MACFCASVFSFFLHLSHPNIEEGSQEEHILELENEIESINSVKAFILRLRSENILPYKIEYINQDEYIEQNNNEHTYSVTVGISRPSPANRRASV